MKFNKITIRHSEMIVGLIFSLFAAYFSFFCNTKYEVTLFLSLKSPNEKVAKFLTETFQVNKPAKFQKDTKLTDFSFGSGEENYLRIVVVGFSREDIRRMDEEIIQGLSALKYSTANSDQISRVQIVKNPLNIPMEKITRHNGVFFILSAGLWGFLIAYFFLSGVNELRRFT